jgi:hypothetical protein
MIAKGIHHHPEFKLGARAAQHDERNLQFRAIAKKIAVPAEYDFDATAKRKIPLRMYANDRYGDCVIAGQANQRVRFELVEQQRLIKISDDEVVDEYFRQSGGNDSGLSILKSLKRWRTSGWVAEGQNYKIKAFAQVTPKDHEAVKQAIYLDLGVNVGLRLPLSASDQIDKNQVWDVVKGARGVAGSWGGHCVADVKFTKDGPVCLTWMRWQPMTWRFWDAYCCECYGVIDAVNTPKKKRGISARELKEYLQTRRAV